MVDRKVQRMKATVGVFMSRLRMTAIAAAVVAAAVVAAASLVGATAAPAFAAAQPHVLVRPDSITGHGLGDGATSQAAESAAVLDLHENYSGCGPWGLVYDTLEAGGYWAAEVVATCGSEN
jgi:hypothetical protein